MEAAGTVVEETAIGAVELIQTVDCVLARVTVNDVQQDHDTTSVCVVD